MLQLGGVEKKGSFETQKSVANEDQVKREDTNATSKFEGRELKELKSPPSGLSPPSKRARAKKEEVVVPDYSIMPPLEDVEKALCDPEGLVRSCAARVSHFLQRLQRPEQFSESQAVAPGSSRGSRA